MRNLDAWLERGHGRMNFYLMQVMSGHRAFNAYLFLMKLAESPECSNCDWRGWDDDAWHTLFECPAFWLYREEAMTALEQMDKLPLMPDSLIPIMLKSAEGWDQVAAFVALTMRRKMEIVREWQRRPIATTNQHPMPDLATLPPHFCRQQPSNESRRRSRPVYFGDIRQPIYHLGLRSWDSEIPKWRESVVAPSAHSSSRGEMGQKGSLPQSVPPFVPTQACCGNPRQGCVRCPWGQFGMRASPNALPNIDY